MPSEKPLDFFFATAVSPTVSSTSSHPAPRDAVALRQTEQVVVRAAAAVHGLGVQQRADVLQRLLQLAGSACRRSAPSPLVGLSRPSIIRIVVDLPAPFGPRKPVTMPGLTGKVRWSTATLLAVPLGQPLKLDHAAHARTAERSPAATAKGGRGLAVGADGCRVGVPPGVSGTAGPERRARSARRRPACRPRPPRHRSASPASRGRWSAGR